jgi:hypothetical protein
MHMLRVGLVAALVAFVGPTHAEQPPTSATGSLPTADDLQIGNGYIYFHQMPATISEIARTTGSPREISAKVVAVPAASLKHHWPAGAALTAIRERTWDDVVLQEQSPTLTQRDA